MFSLEPEVRPLVGFLLELEEETEVLEMSGVNSEHLQWAEILSIMAAKASLIFVLVFCG